MQDSPWENRQCTGKGIIMAAADIGIDLGTANVLVYLDGKGIVVNEPSAVALDKNTGKVLTHNMITREIWGGTQESDISTLRVFMTTLRKKIELHGTGQRLIQTHIGIGYRMVRIAEHEDTDARS